MKRLVLGTIGAIAVTTAIFSEISQKVKAVEVNKIQLVPASYNIPYSEAADNSVKVERWIKEGSGSGLGADYKPWLK